MNIFRLTAIALTLTFSLTANASIIDFQDVSSGRCASSGTLVSSRGFNFTGNPNDPNLYICDAGVIQSNTSAALINANSLSIVSMESVSGDTFSLESFFAGSRLDYIPATTISDLFGATGIQIVGSVFGGATVSSIFNFDGVAWSQFTLSSAFQNLTSVQFTALGGSSAEFVIDDIVVNEPVSAVPVPAAAWLFGSALLGFFGFSRKKATVA